MEYLTDRSASKGARVGNKMQYIFVTGMSGAGKSTALKVFEDAGFYCVDNLPIALIGKFVELTIERGTNVVIGVDVRSGGDLADLTQIIADMKERNLETKVLFMDASDECLMKRYKETRRNHPLVQAGGLEAGIKLEREKLAFIKERADYILDTSLLLTRETKEELANIFLKGEQFNSLYITIASFGFKFGIPQDADLVFDVRCLPNPYYIENLKPLTGNDAAVRDYVMSSPVAQEFVEKLTDMIRFLIPNYIKEGKNQLVIAIGCTGGKHRSVTIANRLYENLAQGEGYGLRIEHRSIAQERVRKEEDKVTAR